LRAVLEPGRERGAEAQVLVTEHGGYRLRAGDGAVDTTRFEELVRDGRTGLARHEFAEASAMLTDALALWRGRGLPRPPGRPTGTVAPLSGRVSTRSRDGAGQPRRGDR